MRGREKVGWDRNKHWYKKNWGVWLIQYELMLHVFTFKSTGWSAKKLADVKNLKILTSSSNDSMRVFNFWFTVKLWFLWTHFKVVHGQNIFQRIFGFWLSAHYLAFEWGNRFNWFSSTSSLTPLSPPLFQHLGYIYNIYIRTLLHKFKN